MNKPDRLTLTRITTAHPAIRHQLLEIYEEICASLTGRAQCRFTEVIRSAKRQDELYAQGRSKPGKIVTNAKAWESAHNFGLGVDVVLILDGKEASWDTVCDYDKDGMADWLEMVRVFESHGWAWYGRNKKFREAPHFECLFGIPLSTLRERVQKGMVDSEGYVKL